jgi:hypothetical protein
LLFGAEGLGFPLVSDLLFGAEDLGLPIFSNLFVCKNAHIGFNTVETYVSFENQNGCTFLNIKDYDYTGFCGLFSNFDFVCLKPVGSLRY